MPTNLHQLAEARSLAIHELIVERLANEPSLVERARRRVAEWRATGSVSSEYVAAWAALLDGPFSQLEAALRDRGERGCELRQASPFAGIVDARTRWDLWRREKQRFEGR